MGQTAYDIEVEVDDPIRERMRNVTQPDSALVKEIVELDDKVGRYRGGSLGRSIIGHPQIGSLVQGINHCKLKRDFMLAFARDPVGFINQWVASQSRDLEVRPLCSTGLNS